MNEEENPLISVVVKISQLHKETFIRNTPPKTQS